MFMCISFPYFSSKTKFWHSFPLLQKPFFIDHILPPWEWPIKTGFHQFVVCRVPVHSHPAMCRLAYTAHTRLQHTLRSGKHPLKTDCIQLAWVHWQLLVSMAQWDCMQSTTTKDGVTPTFTYWNIYVST